MNKKLIVLVVACVLFMAAFAHPMHKPGFRRFKDGKREERKIAKDAPFPVPKKPDFMYPGNLRNNEMEKGFWKNHKGPHHDEHRHEHKKHEWEKIKVKDDGGKMRETVDLVPNKLTEAVINWGTHFSVNISEGESVAVRIVHTSNKYNIEDGVIPKLSLCRADSKRCEREVNGSLSFVFSPDNSTYFNRWRKPRKTFNFALTTSRAGVSGAVAYLYACVGKNVSLETCYTPVVINCVNGKQSDEINVCICDDGYTGKYCSEWATDAPHIYEYDSDFTELYRSLATFIAIVFNVIFYIIFFCGITCCCVCLRACCSRRRAQRGAVVRNRTAVPQARPIVPPPMYAYHPLSVVPPPPPPPAPAMCIAQPQPLPQPRPQPCPQPQRRYDPYAAAQGIEMSTLPPRPANPAYVMPPLAPVKQVPVYIQPPPAPKN